jgi:hypothetical protein
MCSNINVKIVYPRRLGAISAGSIENWAEDDTETPYSQSFSPHASIPRELFEPKKETKHGRVK